MKRILVSLLMVVAMVAVLVAPALADTDVTTNVTVSSGGGNIPIVKCKWEQEPGSPSPKETGDPTHAVNGTQVNPPVVKCTTKPIDYYAVVTDVEESGDVAQVYADVFHPEGCPPPYSTSSDPRGPLFKYEIPFTNKGNAAAQITLVTNAYNAGLISFGAGYNITEVIEEMEKGTAKLWMGEADIDYEQPAGMYKVEVYAVDHGNNQSEVLCNYFEYVAICGIEVDFTSFTYGPVDLGIEKMVAGDKVWNPSGLSGFGQDNLATLRNIGNTWTSLVIEQDDMAFGKDVDDQWNVVFDARMGNDNAYKVNYDPYEETTLPNALGLSQKEELDLSIKVIKGFGSHNGTMTLSCMIRPFDWTGTVVGTADPCV